MKDLARVLNFYRQVFSHVSARDFPSSQFLRVSAPNSGWFLIPVTCIFSLLFLQTLNITELLTAWFVCSK